MKVMCAGILREKEQRYSMHY